MKNRIYSSLTRGFAKHTKFSWMKEIQKTIEKSSKVTNKDVICLWNPGNKGMMEQIVAHSKASLSVMQCSSQLSSKDMDKLNSSKKFRLVPREFSKKALSDLRSFIPPDITKVIILSLRMEIGAFWHICLRSFLYNNHHFCCSPDIEHTDWLHMYLLMNDTDLKNLQTREFQYYYESLTKNVLRTLFTHQVVLHHVDSMGNQLNLVKFTLDRQALGVVKKRKNESQVNTISQEDGENGVVSKEVETGSNVDGEHEEIENLMEAKDKYETLYQDNNYNNGNNMNNNSSNNLNINDEEDDNSITYNNINNNNDNINNKIPTLEDILQDSIDIEEYLTKMDDSNEAEEEKMARNALEDRATIDYRKVNKGIDACCMERIRALMLLKHYDKKTRLRLVPTLDKECRNFGLQLIQKGGMSMSDKMGEISWQGWLHIVRMASQHKGFKGSNLAGIMRDLKDALDHLPDYYSRKNLMKLVK